MRVAPAVDLDEVAQRAIESLANSRKAPFRSVERARIVLLASSGFQNQEIAAELKITPEKAARWRTRYLEGGFRALLKDAPRPGPKPTIGADVIQEIVRRTTQEKPDNATHWSTRTMAEAMAISEKSVRRIWHAHGLKPHLERTFKVSNDPGFAEKLEDVVGLYLNPPEHAILLSVDEKSQIQPLNRTQPGLPLKKGRAGTMTHDYKRNGTATLFAALNTSDGTVISRCDDRHRHQEWLTFLKVIDQVTPPEKELHLIADNYATHKHERVQKWRAIHASMCISLPPAVPGSTWWNVSFATLRKNGSAAAYSRMSKNSSWLSETTSTATIENPNHSSRPQKPPPAWRR